MKQTTKNIDIVSAMLKDYEFLKEEYQTGLLFTHRNYKQTYTERIEEIMMLCEDITSIMNNLDKIFQVYGYEAEEDFIENAPKDLYINVMKDIDKIIDICKRVETLQEKLESIKYLMDDIDDIRLAQD